MIRDSLSFLSVVAVILATTACTGHPYQMAQVELDPSKYEVITEGEIETTGIMLFGFIPIQQNNRVQRAVDYLLRQHGGDELVNITIRDRWFWAYVLNGYKTSVRGTVVKKK